MTAVGPDWSASETPLVNDWCQQFPSHSIGSLEFGADGYLYVSGGEGASWTNADWGQFGGTSGSPPPTPANPCGDPPFPVGTPQTKPTAEGGALRSQSHLRAAGEPRVLNGAILRIDPATGLAAPDNPLIGSGDLNEQRIIGYGFRNPFRMTIRPGTNEVWIADVGWTSREEINRIPDLSTARNFGWPCYEGTSTLASFADANICPDISDTTAPFYFYAHSSSVVPGDGCPTGGSSIAGLAFYQGGSNYPSNYSNALFFSDYTRKCMWVMFPDAAGVIPNPANRAAFASAAAGPVNLTIGPNGNLFYVDFDGGQILEVKYGLAAIATATPMSGDAPLTVDFDGTGSIPAQLGDTLSYAWDLDGDGEFDDSTDPTPTHTYDTAGAYTVRLKVTDQRGGSAISDPITITPGNTAPTAFVDTPASSLQWKVGDTISFSGHAIDAQDGTLAASALSWQVLIHHCPSNCHTHVYETFPGVASGSFPAPDHDYPAYLELALTATDSQGLTNTASVNINPMTAALNFQTVPAGLQLTVGSSPPQTTPFTQTVIVNSVTAAQAPSPQGSQPNIWEFSSWSDGGAQNHNITAPAGRLVLHRDVPDPRGPLDRANRAGDGLRGSDAHVYAQRRERGSLDRVLGRRRGRASRGRDARVRRRHGLVLFRDDDRDLHGGLPRPRRRARDHGHRPRAGSGGPRSQRRVGGVGDGRPVLGQQRLERHDDDRRARDSDSDRLDVGADRRDRRRRDRARARGLDLRLDARWWHDHGRAGLRRDHAGRWLRGNHDGPAGHRVGRDVRVLCWLGAHPGRFSRRSTGSPVPRLRRHDRA